MKRNFLTGLAIIVPIALTYVILLFFINLLTNPFLALFDYLVGDTAFSTRLQNYALAKMIYKLLILLILPVVIIAVGFFGRGFIIKWLLSLIDSMAARIPIFNKIYISIKETVHAFLKPNLNNFSDVVLVPFPNPSIYTLGFVMHRDVGVNRPKNRSNPENQSKTVAVLIPGTPTLTAAYLQMFPKDQLIYLDIPVEEAVKAVISCGLILKDLPLKKV